ncbi:unnamed protein product, partial [Pleuronectes platessa]
GDEALCPITAAQLGSDAQRPDATAAAAGAEEKKKEEEEVWSLLVNYNWDTELQGTRGVFYHRTVQSLIGVFSGMVSSGDDFSRLGFATEDRGDLGRHRPCSPDLSLDY